MSRIPNVRYEELDSDGRAFWDGVVGSRGSHIVDADGVLVGPFNAWVQATSVGRPAMELGGVVRFGTSIERGLSELAIITMAARWKAEFEWSAHSRMAVEHGVEQAVVDAIGAGREPELHSTRDEAVYRLARQLGDQGTVTPEVLDAAVGELGRTATVELVTLCGYYTMVSYVLNAFGVPPPRGVAPHWS